jgi:hypothetical protein
MRGSGEDPGELCGLLTMEKVSIETDLEQLSDWCQMN